MSQNKRVLQENFTLSKGDWIATLRTLPSESVQCAITSPPYWGLRDYGTASWTGGAADCDHKIPASTLGGGTNKSHRGSFTANYKTKCRRCGAVRVDDQLGLESTPEQYVAKLVEGFAELRRVLRKDGVLWLNLGDTYIRHREDAVSGLKMKDLAGMPWRVALALQANGWWLRQDIIWHKPNPMTESIKDRCTRAHEYMFMLTKNRHYFFDSAAIKEPVQKLKAGKPPMRNKRSVWTIAPQAREGAHFAVFPEALVEPCVLSSSKPGDIVLDPFTGSSTTGVVALRHGRRFLGLELNPEYIELSRKRLKAVVTI